MHASLLSRRRSRGPIRRPGLLPTALFVAAWLVGAPAGAQDIGAAVDELFGWATRETPGCAVGVSKSGERVVSRAYGSANLDRELPIGPGTVFDVGSVQKQFVAAAVLLLAEDGRIALDDDIRGYFPELPDYGHAITVDHLLTHTSGVRDWVGLRRMSKESEDALTMILRQRGLNFAPGEEWSYSNSGYVLLKELVARATGVSFSEVARTRLFEPLGMERTTYASDVRDVEDRALAYEKAGDDWRLNILVGDERGDGGALLSTAGDLLTWNEALDEARLGEWVTAKIQEPARLNNGRRLGYARGLFLDEERGGRSVWHGGSAAAYKAVLARLTDQDLSVAILCNAGDSAPPARFAARIVELLVPGLPAAGAEVDEPAAVAGGAGGVGGVGAIGPEALDPEARAGLYLHERTGEPLRLAAREGRLRVVGGPELVPVAGDRFRVRHPTLSFMSEDDFELRFPSPDRLVLTSMEGETTEYHRARAYAPDAAELRAFIGRYESDELRSVLEVESGEEGLVVRLNGSRPFPFVPVGRDMFELGAMTARFRRDESGRVVALDYRNPVLRDVPFTRVSDGA